MKRVALGEVVTIVGGGTPSREIREYYDGKIPWCTVKDLPGTLFLHGTREHISEFGLKNSASRLIPANTVILGTRMNVGKAVLSTTQIAINQDLKALHCGTLLRPDYLLHFLNSMQPKLEGMASGATVKGITIEDIQELQLPLPDLPTQHRIAALLTRADRLRRLRRHALGMVEESIGPIFRQQFAGTDWPTHSVAELAKTKGMRTGPFGSALLHSEFVDSGIAVLGIDNAVKNRFTWDERRYITEAKYQELKRYTVHPGDVIITIMGTWGRCAVVPDNIPPAINTKHLCCITLNPQHCLPSYLHGAFLHHPHVLRQLGAAKKGAIMDALNMEIISNLEIPLPPLPLQQKFTALATRHERLRRQHAESLRQAEHLFQTLLHQAFQPVA